MSSGRSYKSISQEGSQKSLFLGFFDTIFMLICIKNVLKMKFTKNVTFLKKVTKKRLKNSVFCKHTVNLTTCKKVPKMHFFDKK